MAGAGYMAETISVWDSFFSPNVFFPFPVLLFSQLLSFSVGPLADLFLICLSTFFFCPYLSPRRIWSEIILQIWVKVLDLVALGSRRTEENQAGCFFVQRRLHSCPQPQHFCQGFCFAHSCCLLKISICITGIYLFSLFLFTEGLFWAQRQYSAAKEMTQTPSRGWEVWDIIWYCERKLRHEPLGRRKSWCLLTAC